MKRDLVILGAVAFAILPFALWTALRVFRVGLVPIRLLYGLIVLRWLNWLATAALVCATTLSDRHFSLSPLAVGCLLGGIGWDVAVRWLRRQYPAEQLRPESPLNWDC